MRKVLIGIVCLCAVGLYVPFLKGPPHEDLTPESARAALIRLASSGKGFPKGSLTDKLLADLESLPDEKHKSGSVEIGTRVWFSVERRTFAITYLEPTFEASYYGVFEFSNGMWNARVTKWSMT